MNNSYKSTFLTTDHQTKYSEDMFNSSINRVRNRINILSISSVKPQYLSHMTTPSRNLSHGIYAVISKIMFDSEVIQQDIKYQSIESKKTKHIIRMLAQDIRKKGFKAEILMQQKLIDLQNIADLIKDKNLKQSIRLNVEVQQRRRENNKIKQALGEVQRKIDYLQQKLGCYTGRQKLMSL